MCPTSQAERGQWDTKQAEKERRRQQCDVSINVPVSTSPTSNYPGNHKLSIDGFATDDLEVSPPSLVFPSPCVVTFWFFAGFIYHWPFHILQPFLMCRFGIIDWQHSVWCVALVCLSCAHQFLSVPLFSRTGQENKLENLLVKIVSRKKAKVMYGSKGHKKKKNHYLLSAYDVQLLPGKSISICGVVALEHKYLNNICPDFTLSIRFFLLNIASYGMGQTFGHLGQQSWLYPAQGLGEKNWKKDLIMWEQQQPKHRWVISSVPATNTAQHQQGCCGESELQPRQTHYSPPEKPDEQGAAGASTESWGNLFLRFNPAPIPVKARRRSGSLLWHWRQGLVWALPWVLQDCALKAALDNISKLCGKL